MVQPNDCMDCMDCSHRPVCRIQEAYERALQALNCGNIYNDTGDEVTIERFTDSPFIFSVQCPYKLVIVIDGPKTATTVS